MNQSLNPIILAVLAVLALIAGALLLNPPENAGVVETPTSTETAESVAAPVAPSTPVETGQSYVVQEGDDLSNVATRAYGSTELSPAIVWFSTLKADNEDPQFFINTQNNNLRPGQKIVVPTIAEVFAAQAMISEAARVRSDLLELTIPQVQQMMATGEITSRLLVEAYLERIEALNHNGPVLNAVLEINPDALAIADALDAERQTSGVRGPLHGIPILLKDNIDTADQMQTTAGSLALIGTLPAQDATVTERLRAAGAVILGKASLSEWANYRGNGSISGWSARGNLGRNPYRLDFTPWGSSSGSGIAVAANLVTVAIGTETAGSITAPSVINGVVGIKPTVGLTSRAGVIPIAHSFDTVGPMTRTVRDAAIVLGALTGVDARDPMTANSEGRFYSDYTQFLDSKGLHGARIGLPRPLMSGMPADVERLFDRAVAVMAAAGAEIVEIEDFPHLQDVFDYNDNSVGITSLLSYEFYDDIAAYLAARVAAPNVRLATMPRTINDLIELNKQLADQELKFFGQELFEHTAARGEIDENQYQEALATYRLWTGEAGIKAVMDQYDVDVLLMPTNESLARIYAALAGYPIVSVPGGFTDNGLPWGLGFVGPDYSEPVLIKLAYAYEQLTFERRPPRFLLTLRGMTR